MPATREAQLAQAGSSQDRLGASRRAWRPRTRTGLAACVAGLLLFVGCTFGLGEARGWDAVAREANAIDNFKEAKFLEGVAEHAPEDVAVDIKAAALRIQVRAVDEAQRARIAQQDHNHKPKVKVVPRSTEDDVQVQAYAGMAGARDVRRTKLKELPGKVAGLILDGVIDATPTPIKRALSLVMWSLAIGAPIVLLLALWGFLKIRFLTKVGDEAIDRFNRIEDKEERKRLLASAHTLGRYYEKKERK